MLGRLTFLVLEVGAIVVFARLVFDVPLRGSLALFAATCVLGALAFAGLGLLVASRARTVEGVSGLMNVVMMPMWIGSGVFFSTSRFPELVQPAIQLLPLTAVIDALRAIMLDGAGVSSQDSGLCQGCRWARRIRTRRGTSFLLCAMSERDPHYPRYPRLPVRDCPGYAPRPPGERGGPDSASG